MISIQYEEILWLVLAYHINDEVQITSGDCLSTKQSFLMLDSANTSTSLLHNHELLYHLLLIRIEEVSKLASVKGGIEFEEGAESWDW